MRLGWAAVITIGLLVALPSRIAAHEIPATVTVLAFVKPEAQRLRMLLRVPLESMRDVDFPLRGPGYLDIPRAEPLMRQAARVWLAGYLSLYEGDSRLSDGRIVATHVSLPADRSFVSYD